MSNDWLNKAKEAAQKAADEAKKLAEAAKNANYGEMLDKTKNMAMHAADEAKKAAGNIMKKDQPETPEINPEQINPQNQQSATPVNKPTSPEFVTPTTVPQAVVTPVTPASASNPMHPNETVATEQAKIIAKLQHVELLLSEIKALLLKH
jgi:hypothetical protein